MTGSFGVPQLEQNFPPLGTSKPQPQQNIVLHVHSTPPWMAQWSRPSWSTLAVLVPRSNLQLLAKPGNDVEPCRALLLNVAEYPLSFDNVPAMVFPLTYLALVDLHDSTWPSYFFAALEHCHLAKFPAKHVPVHSCMGTKVQLLRYLPLLQALTPTVGELDHLFNGQICLSEPATISYACLVPVPLAFQMFSAFPCIAIWPITAFNPFHVWLADSAETPRCN